MKELISPQEAANRIGVSVRTIKVWMTKPDHPLPSIQVGPSGSHFRILTSEIEPWIKAEASKSGSSRVS